MTASPKHHRHEVSTDMQTMKARLRTMTMMKLSNLKTLLLVGMTLAVLPGLAAAQEACSSYTVKEGDSLGSIAEAAYGSFDYQMIFNANRNAIGNPNNLVAGTVLQIPCEDGQLSADSDVTQIIEEEEAKQAKRAKSNIYEPPIKLVSGNGWAPFAGEDLKGGGMLVRLATTALQRGGNDREYNVSFVDDWAAHTETLLPLGAFDVSIAWYIPDCSKLDMLSEGMVKRCTELDATLPIYESAVGFYTLADNQYANVRNFSDLSGARICRPNGWFTFDLEEEGLVEPLVDMIQPAQPADCFKALLDGDADVTSFEIENATAEIKALEGKGEFVQNPYLSKLLQLSFVSHKTNPRGRVYIAMLNKGLNEMRESGEWYAVIADSLADFNKTGL